MAGPSQILTTVQNGVVAVNQLVSFLRNATTTNLSGQSALRIDGIRTLLVAPLTLYVRTDGSDSNNGLTNSATGAFLTLQAAYNALASKYDTAGFTVTIQGTPGVNSFSSGIAISQGWTGCGPVVLDLGAGGAIAYGGGGGVVVNATLPANLTVQNVRFSSSGAAGVHLNHMAAGKLVIGSNVEFASATTAGYHLLANSGGTISCGTNYTISGDAGIHAYAKTGGNVDLYAGVFGTTTTISANISIAQAFAYCDPLGGITSIAAARTISLSSFTVSGTRYNVASGGAINTQGGGPNYFPGTSSGTGGGVYL